MKKFLFFLMCLGLAVGMSSCSSDDENVAVYEENPTTLNGMWHLVKADFGMGGIRDYEAGDVTIYFYPNQTVQVETKEVNVFMATGTYSYTIIETQTNKYDGTVFTTINLGGQQCTYWFKDGIMVLDFGMACDAPGYYFKKKVQHTQ